MSEVRAVHDPVPPIGDSLCLSWVRAEVRMSARLCCRPKGHPGNCLPTGPIPRTDVSTSNPRWEAAA